MKLRDLSLLFFAACLAIPLACKKENRCDCFKSTGSIITESRDITPVSRIFLDDNINLVLTSGDTALLRVEAGSHLLPLIKTTIDGNEIRIRNNNTCNWARSYKHKPTVYLTLPRVDYIEYSGSGDISMTNTFTCDTIAVNSWDGSGSINLDLDCRASHLNLHTGPADINVKGRAAESYIWSAGNGMVHGENLITNFSFVQHKGTGNCYVNVTHELHAKISWTGNVYYRGNPQIVDSGISGKGKLIKE